MGNKTKIQLFLDVNPLKYVDSIIEKYGMDGIEINRSQVINMLITQQNSQEEFKSIRRSK